MMPSILKAEFGIGRGSPSLRELLQIARSRALSRLYCGPRMRSPLGLIVRERYGMSLTSPDVGVVTPRRQAGWSPSHSYLFGSAGLFDSNYFHPLPIARPELVRPVGIMNWWHQLRDSRTGARCWRPPVSAVRDLRVFASFAIISSSC